MRFSIIVPTYNEENDIEETLNSLVALNYPNYEVFIVDDSTDNTPAIIQRYANQGIQLIHPGGGGRCEARNKGIQLATGDVIVVLNADVQLPINFLQQIKSHYDSGADLLGVGSKVINDDRLFARYVDCQYLLKEHKPPQKQWPHWTEGFSCRRELAIKVGLFPAGFPIAMYAGEDIFFAKNLVKCGGKKHFDKNIIVQHIAPSSFKEYWHIRKTRGQAYSQYRRYIDRWPMWKIAIWNLLKSTVNTINLITFILPLRYCWRLSRFSKYGRKDWPRLYYAWFLENIAMTYGLWQELLVIRNKEKGAKS